MKLNEIKSFDYVVLPCIDINMTATFYRDVLRLQLEVDRENWKSFRLGATLLTLRPRGIWTVCDDGTVPQGVTPVQLGFRVSPPAIFEWEETLVKHGVEIVRGPTEIPQWRHNTLFFRDPEGTLIELYAEL